MENLGYIHVIQSSLILAMWTQQAQFVQTPVEMSLQSLPRG